MSSRVFKGGFFDLYAQNLINFGFKVLVESGSRGAPFIALFGDVPCVIIPFVKPEKVRVAIFYGAKRTLSASRLAHDDLAAVVQELIDDWLYYCRAYAVADLCPWFQGHSHNGTRNSAAELVQPDSFVRMPTLREIDRALNTSLEMADARNVAHITRKKVMA